MKRRDVTGAIASDMFARKHTRRAEVLQAFDRDAEQNLICSRVRADQQDSMTSSPTHFERIKRS